METKNLSSATHKCVLVIDNAQPTGIVANIASVLSMTLGCKVNNIVSHDVYDKQGEKHLGITQLPIPILGASQEKIKEIRKLFNSLKIEELVLVDFLLLLNNLKLMMNTNGKCIVPMKQTCTTLALEFVPRRKL
ncbi:DUF2000 domain-containing protein [Bacteroides fragilis]|nr:DUF2000 domain-containing protein [Bacteroides fragilis]